MLMEQRNRNMQRLQKVLESITKIISQETLAILLAAISNILFPLAFLYPNEHKFHPIENNLQRGIAVAFSHIAICKIFGISLDFKSKSDLKYLFIRNTIILCQQFIYAGMYFVVSYPILNTINLIGPLAVFVLDYYINGVQVSRKQFYGILLGFIGVLITINADIISMIFVENHQQTTTYQNYLVENIYLKTLLSILFAIATIAWAFAIVIQKRIKNEPGIKISYFLGLQFIVTSGVISSFGHIQIHSLDIFMTSVLCSGLVMAFCQITFISALRLTKHSGKLAILMLLYGIPSQTISIFRYGEQLNWITVFGFGLMSFGLYKCIFNK